MTLINVSALVLMISFFLTTEAKSMGFIKPGHVFTDCQNCPEMVVIPAGSFDLNLPSVANDPNPTQRITFNNSFAIGKTEITRGQFARFVTETAYDAGDICTSHEEEEKMAVRKGQNWRNPGYSQEDNHPVVCVSRNDAQAYVKWLSSKTGRQYRLPSDAELAYAISVFAKHGIRGGGLNDTASAVQANSRMAKNPNTRDSFLGFRIVRIIPIMSRLGYSYH